VTLWRKKPREVADATPEKIVQLCPTPLGFPYQYRRSFSKRFLRLTMDLNMKPLVHLVMCSIVCAACSKSSDQPATKRRRDAGRTATAPTALVPASTPVPAGTAVMRATVSARGGGNCEATIDDDCRKCLLQKSGDAGLVPTCESLQGNAKAGPAAGTARSDLCQETLDCVRRTKCHAMGSLVECYCGTAIDHGTCYATKTEAAGPCKKEFDRSLEVPAGSTGYDALQLITEPHVAGGVAGIIATFENTQCVPGCLPYIATACE
jgi:hypothetical protein